MFFTDHSYEHQIRMVMDLQKIAIDLGFKIPKNFIEGPCQLLTPSALTIDEQLNVYKCPGYLYEKPVGRINDNGTLIITDNFWYEAITLEPDCVSDCIYGPICYGGCHFQAGSLEKNLCDRKTHDILIKSRIKLYADSLVKQKNGLKI